VDALYRTIITAGTHKASNIKVAEAAKVIENTQRDLNIALVNELAMLFSRLKIDTLEVLEAAGTKWNFLPFRPGLVGGHCIGVDPYYLTHKAQAVGYHPEVILAGRRINDGMGRFVASEMIKAMLRKEIQIKGARVLIMGLTFKENCPDLRNTRVIDVIRELEEYQIKVDVYDPWVTAGDALEEYGVDLITDTFDCKYDGVVVAVGHREFFQLKENFFERITGERSVIFDLKGVFPVPTSDLRL
jgi:UDP-N-acetyl-D-galactosamine dehydrogenase